jgi:hypothetical protein
MPARRWRLAFDMSVKRGPSSPRKGVLEGSGGLGRLGSPCPAPDAEVVAPKIRNRTLDAVALAGLTLGGEPCGPCRTSWSPARSMSPGITGSSDYLSMVWVPAPPGRPDPRPFVSRARSPGASAGRPEAGTGLDQAGRECPPPGWQFDTALARGRFAG